MCIGTDDEFYQNQQAVLWCRCRLILQNRFCPCLAGNSEVTIPLTVALFSGDDMFPGESSGSGVDVGVVFDFLTLPEEENCSDRLLSIGML